MVFSGAKKLSVLAAWALVLVAPAKAGEAGSTGANFLKVPVGARAIAMGESFTAIADDASATYWNPAGLSLLQKKEVSFMETFYLATINYHYLAAAMPLGKRHGVGIMANIFTMDPLLRTDQLGVNTGAFNVMLGNAGVGFSRMFSPRLRAGIAAKAIFQKLDTVAYNTFGFDLGFILKTGIQRLSLGASLQNLGFSVKANGTYPDPANPTGPPIELKEGAPLPLTARIGFGYQLESGVAALDVVIPVDNKIKVSAGLEWWYQKSSPFGFAVRLGYKYQGAPDYNDLGTNLAGLSLGTGLRYKIGSLDPRLDYAFQPFGDLGEAHRIGLAVGF